MPWKLRTAQKGAKVSIAVQKIWQLAGSCQENISKGSRRAGKGEGPKPEGEGSVILLISSWAAKAVIMNMHMVRGCS